MTPYDHFKRWRDRWLSSPRFQRAAVRFPPTRPIASRRARELFDLSAGFVYSQVLLACVRLRVFERLLEQPRDAEALAPVLGLPVDGTSRLLEAAVALRLVERRRGGTYGLGVLGAAILGNPGAIAMIAHHHLLYEDLADPVALLRGPPPDGTRLSRFWAYARTEFPATVDAAGVADYSALMAASQTLIADDILDAYPVARHGRLLDVGGGDGVFLARALTRNKKLSGILFDLPAVAERARERLDAAGLGGRATVESGDFDVTPLPEGADIISLVRVLHDHDDAMVERLLKTIRRTLPDDGVLLVAEPMADTRGAEPMGGAYFGFYLMAMGSGRPRSRSELMRFLTSSGFARVRPARTRRPLLTQILVATPT